MDNGKRKAEIRRFLGNVAVCALPVFTGLFFAPMEVFLGNIQAFDFSLSNVWWVLLLLCLILSALGALLLTVLPQKLSRVLTACAFALGICFYLQALFMNGHMIGMDGTKVVYSSGLKAANAAVWVLLFVLIVGGFCLLSAKGRQKTGETVLLLVSCALLLMQTAGLVSLAVANGAKDSGRVKAVLSTEGEFDLSKGNNVVFFVLDRVDRQFVEEALREEPDLFDGLDGFTVYPDCISSYTRTFPSLVYLLTEQRCWFNKPFEKYVDDAYENSAYWKELAAECEDIRVFTDEVYVGEAGWKDIDNRQYTDARSLSSLSLKGLVKSAAKVGLYRSMPYALKERVLYDVDVINSEVIRDYSDILYLWGHDVDFCRHVLDGEVTADAPGDTGFHLYHLFGTHTGLYMDENCEYAEDPTTSQALRGCFRMIRSYVKQMKELGVYDDATIIITTDHGISLPGEHLRYENPVAILMLAKPAHAGDAPCRTSSAQVSHDDLFAAVIDAFGGDGSAFGTSIFKVPEGEQRERRQYLTAFYETIDGEVALREYAVNGDANDFGSWALTGRNWDIFYAEDSASKCRLTDEEPDAQICAPPEE